MPLKLQLPQQLPLRLPQVHEEPDKEFPHQLHRHSPASPLPAFSSISSNREILPLGAASSSSAAPFSLQRALLSTAGRRGSPTTPIPSWKMFDNPFYDAMAAQHQHKRPAVSARKLAATLWELQEITPLSDRGSSTRRIKEAQQQQQLTSQRLRTLNGKRNGSQFAHASSPASSRISQRSLRRASIQHKFGDGARRNVPSTGQPSSAHSQVLRFLGRRTAVRPPYRNGDPSEFEADDTVITPSNSMRNAGHGPTTSSELLKVLNRIWILEEQHNSNMSTVAALRADLERARDRVQELTIEQKFHRKDIETLTKKLSDEKALWQEREEETIRAAIKTIEEELEDERKSKRKLEMLNKKVAKELSEVKKSLGTALQELERERKARELMEDVCDELAREIGEDRAQVEEMKRASAKVREEVEEERKMLQMAEVWREERVQMKLAEARLQLEEKNTALDKLRSELEAFIKAKRAWDAQDEGSRVKVSKNPDVHRSTVDDLETPNEANLEHERTPQGSQELVYHGAVGDGLRMIELNDESFMGDTRGIRWDYTDVTQPEAETEGRMSIDRGSSSVERTSKGKQGQGSRQGLERTRSSPVEIVMAAGEKSEAGRHPESQWIDRSIERGELRDWNEERKSSVDSREGLHSPWQSDNEESLSHVIMGTRSKGRKPNLRSDTLSRTGGTVVESTSLTYEATGNSDVYGSSAPWRFQSLGSSRDLRVAPVFSPLQQSANFTSSPTRQWGQYWSSPDPGSPRLSRVAKASNDIPRINRDNSLKAKLLEAKLEGQQARLRNGKGLERR